MPKYKRVDVNTNLTRSNLREFVLLLKSGEWECIPEIADELLLALSNLQTWQADNAETDECRDASEIVRLLDTAISLCAERKVQIAPLLDALACRPNPPKQP